MAANEKQRLELLHNLGILDGRDAAGQNTYFASAFWFGQADDLLTASFGICSIPAVSGPTDKLFVKATEALGLGQRQGTGKIKYADIA